LAVKSLHGSVLRGIVRGAQSRRIPSKSKFRTECGPCPSRNHMRARNVSPATHGEDSPPHCWGREDKIAGGWCSPEDFTKAHTARRQCRCSLSRTCWRRAVAVRSYNWK
jgi:hypothetical protein